MVRPVARFRPAARRSSGGLIPVFAVDQPGTNRIQVWSGSLGLLATLDPNSDVPRSLAPTNLLGVNAVITSYLLASGNVVIDGQQQSLREDNEILRVREEVVNGSYVVSFLRAHWVTHTYTVFWRTNVPGVGPVGAQQQAQLDSIFAAVYDLVTFTVDLETGAKQVSDSPVYSYSADVDSFVSGINTLRFNCTATISILTTARAIKATLPAAHPFKSCEPDAFGDPDNSAGTAAVGVVANDLVTTGSYSFVGEPGDLFTQAFRFGQTVVTGRYSRKVLSLGGLRGLNTATAQRALDFTPTYQLIELGTYALSAGAALCSIAPELGVAWSGTSDLYDLAVLQERAEVFGDLDAMNQSDQDLFLQSTQAGAASLSELSGSVASTVEAIYFLQADVMVNTPGQLSFDFGKTRRLYYWIQD